MPLVTGNVTTFGLGVPAVIAYDIEFVPSGPAIAGDRYVLHSVPVRVRVEDYTGSFSVSLASTETSRPATHYKIRIRSLDPSGNFTYIDFPDWELRVPTTGGPIADLLNLSGNPAMAWTGDDPPPVPPVSGMWWLDTDPSSSNYGWLMEWE